MIENPEIRDQIQPKSLIRFGRNTHRAAQIVLDRTGFGPNQSQSVMTLSAEDILEVGHAIEAAVARGELPATVLGEDEA